MRALVVTTLMAGLMALVATGGFRTGQTIIAAPAPPPEASSIVASESAGPAPGAGEQPVRQVRAIALSDVDHKPVASIPRTPAPHAPGPSAAAAFAPVERAPGFSGFKVTAGE